jgi:replicative DNA helicase
MATRVTLYVDEEVVDKAKRYVKRSHTSLSKIVNDYLKLLSKENRDEEMVQAPTTRSLRGILRGKEISETSYRRHLEEKYL